MSRGSTLFLLFRPRTTFKPLRATDLCRLRLAVRLISLLSQIEFNFEHLPDLHILTCLGSRFESHFPDRLDRFVIKPVGQMAKQPHVLDLAINTDQSPYSDDPLNSILSRQRRVLGSWAVERNRPGIDVFEAACRLCRGAGLS